MLEINRLTQRLNGPRDIRLVLRASA